jgi:hypothetical protein
MNRGLLCLVGSGSSGVLDISEAVSLAQRDGWDVGVALTPTAADWLADDLPGLAELTGRPVRHVPRRPGEPNPWPPISAVLLAPATFNTLNRVALGLTDSVATRIAVEALGRRGPLVVVPCVNADMAGHPQLARSVRILREAGARVLWRDESGWGPSAPGVSTRETLPWRLALSAVVR